MFVNISHDDGQTRLPEEIRHRERNNSKGYGSMEYCLSSALGQPERIIAYNTYQVKNYDRFELASFSEEAKRKWRDEHWAEDLQKAFDAGKRMVDGFLR